MTGRLGILLLLAALGCGRARADDSPPSSLVVPAASSPTVAPPAAAASTGSARPAEVEPDREQLPCPNGLASCDGLHPVVARGVLARAERYLASCRACRQREQVKATARRMRAIVERNERSRRRNEPADCRSSLDAAILVSPDSVVVGDRPRVVVASDAPLHATLEVSRVGGGAVAARDEPAAGGPPWFSVTELDPAERGDYQIVLRERGRVLACQRFSVSERHRGRLRSDSVWKSVRGWDRGAENLYSAWIAHLFDAPEGKRWKGISQVLGDPARNFLFDHFAQGEDSVAERLALRPDCADAPYLLRAYFAWKLGLPFGLHRRDEWVTNETPSAGDPLPDRPRWASPGQFRDFAETLVGDVTARSLRTPPGYDDTDLHPVALSREHLRPGVVFADPYGHTLTLVKWVPQTASAPGQLFAVDAQPDGTVGIRRFWRGNFLFVDQSATAGFGFKAFRPIVREDGGVRLLSNAEVAVADGYGGFSLEQSRLLATDFYARMARLVSPEPPSPTAELDELVNALMTQLERRVAEVAVADELAGERKTPIEMPEGRAMFQSAGAWEAASTPCRDLRLLVGLDAVLSFPEEAARTEPDLRRQLNELLERRAKSRFIDYVRSDGSTQRLSLAEIIARRAGLEMAYNPNDCPELRWAAAEGSAELQTCRRRAPDAQRRQMERMRYWFARRYSCG